MTDNRKVPPVVEPQYENPTPEGQSWWNQGIYGTMLIIGIVFVVIILVVALL